MIELRNNAISQNANQVKPQTVRKIGTVKKKNDILTETVKAVKRNDIEIFKPKTTVDIQNDLEKERAWIRKLNCKIYDNKISNMAMDTTNGSELLKKEISDSEQRL
jgi:hypothetical protein